MMLEYFTVFANSIPIAVMFIAFMAACVFIYLIHWLKKSEEADKAIRANQAVVVRDRREDY